MNRESEQYNCELRSLHDRISYVNGVVQTNDANYTSFLSSFTTLSVINQVVSGTTSQTINIPTTFSGQTYTYTDSATLVYNKVLAADNANQYEVVNFKTLMNIVYGNTGLFQYNQPIFTSDRIGIVDTFSNTTSHTNGNKYNTVNVTPAPDTNTHKLIQIKILKYNAKAAYDNSDKSWIELFGSAAIPTIPNSTVNIGKLPLPVDYDVYLEYTGLATDYPFIHNRDLTDRVKTKISNMTDIAHSLIIDSDGDLSLILYTNFIYSDIFYGSNSNVVDLNCDSSMLPQFYVVVRRWSW